MKDKALSRRIFLFANEVFMWTLAAICVLPFIHILAISFSSGIEATSGRVLFWPRDIQTFAYEWMFRKPEVWITLGNSLQRVVLGYVINMFLVVLTAYPLSRESNQFKWRTLYVWYFFITMLFSGGLVPTFLIVKYTKIMGTIWSLIMPTAVGVWKMIRMLNFFRSVPKELEEAALIDGAGHLRVLFKIYIPISMPAIATISLFIILNHWNAWFDGMIYMNDMRSYPFQTYLRTLVANTNMSGISNLMELEDIIKLSDKTVKAAQIIIGSIPIFITYPFLQRYFTKGIVIGSVKG